MLRESKRDREMAGYVASIMLLTINKYQAAPAILSCLCYGAAFYRSLQVPAIKSLLGNTDGTKLVTWKVCTGFMVGLITWRIWIYMSRLLIRGEIAIRDQARTGRGKLFLLGLRAPALTLFPVAGAYISKYFVGEDGTYVMIALALSFFLIQLAFPYENDFGSVDTFEGVHLPILPQIDRPFYVVLGFSFLYYSRKLFILLTEEIVKQQQRQGRRRRRRRRQGRRGRVRRQNLQLTGVNQGTELSKSSTGSVHLRLLVYESKALVAVAQTECFQRALSFLDKKIGGDGLLEYTEILVRLGDHAEKAEKYLDSLPEEV